MNLEFDMDMTEELEREVMVINPKAEAVPSAGFWYDLFEGGYFDPDKFLSDTQGIIDVKTALRTLKYYKDALESAGLIEEC